MLATEARGKPCAAEALGSAGRNDEDRGFTMNKDANNLKKIHYALTLTHKQLGLQSAIQIKGSVCFPQFSDLANVEKARREAAALCVSRANAILLSYWQDFEVQPTWYAVSVWVSAPVPPASYEEKHADEQEAAHRLYEVQTDSTGRIELVNTPAQLSLPPYNKERVLEQYRAENQARERETQAREAEGVVTA